MKKRNASIELARLLGCLIVIGCHTYLSITVNGSLSISRTSVACLCADGVGIFWLITGFYLFNYFKYSKALKRFCFNVFIPMLVCGILFILLSSCSSQILNNESIFGGISRTFSEYKGAVFSIMKLQNPFPLLGQTWYVYTYFLLILVSPILNCFAEFLDGSKGRTITFLSVSFGVLIINDIFKNETLGFSHQALYALLPASIIVLYGHILSRHLSAICSKVSFLVPLAIFILANAARVAIVYFNASEGNNNKQILYWYSSIGIICAICITVLCSKIFNRAKSDDTIPQNVIRFLSSYTFPIYLVQYLFIEGYNRLSIPERMLQILNKYLPNAISVFLYTLIMVILVFIGALVLCIVARFVKTLFKKRKAIMK